MKVKLTRDGRNRSSPWVLRWSVYDPDAGKDKWRQKSFKYKAQAEQLRAELKAAGAEQELCSNPALTLSEFRRQWLQTKGQRLAAATLDLYIGTFDRLEEYFGKHGLLTDITPQQADCFITSQQRRSRATETKPLSQSTRNQIARNCVAVFAVAIRWKLLQSNPFESLEMPEPEQRRFHRLTPQEEDALRAVAPSLRRQALYDVLLTTGARLNEVQSRTWADFDFVNGTMVISNREATTDLPPFKVKTRRQRVIPLSPGTIDLLTELQADAPEGVPYVFLTKERYERVKARWRQLRSQGKPWKNRYLTNNVLRDFKAHCRKAGIKPAGTLCLHTLRKNAGQTLADARLPVNVVQAILGHSDPRTTLQYYSQVDPYHHKQVTKALTQRRFGRNGRRKGNGKKYVSGTYRAEIGRTQG